MRVVIAGDYPENPPTIVGGIQAVIYNTIQRLGDYDDLDLHVVTCEKWRDRPLRRQVVEAPAGLHPAGGGWTVHYLPSPSRIPHTLTMLTTDRWAIRRHIQALAPDLIHAHGQAAAYPYAAFDTKLPTLVTVHGINMLEAQMEQRGGRLKGLLRTSIWGYIERRCLRIASDIVVISPFVEKVIAPHTRARLHTIENPVHQSFFDLELNPYPGRVLMVGTIRPVKGMLEAVQAMRLVRQQLPTAELYIAGGLVPPFREYGEQLKRLLVSCDAASYVHLMGYLDHRTLLEAYRTSQVFLLPSWQESSPVALAQAMAAGLPSVVSNIGGTEHLIEEGVTGYRVPPRDVSALAGRIVQLLGSPDTCRLFGDTAHQLAVARLSPQMAAQKTHDLYLQLRAGIQSPGA